ncbi:energy transducer TonB [candidate division WOR-3 bacterium]|nr:energy transducer TonB [candidate division WOR-3 bacterium]
MNGQRSIAIDLAIALSTAAHIGMFFLFSRAAPTADACYDLQEVTFMDVTYRPEVARILPKIQSGGGGGEVSDVPTYAAGIAAEDIPAIDMNATLERDHSQARIDLDRYELDRGGSMDVINLGGKGSNLSTDEILAQAPVPLARGLDRGQSGPGGLRGVPGVRAPAAQLQIEHRALAKAPTRALPEMATRDLPQVSGPVTKGTNFMVAGPISQREISRRVVPRYPQWAVQRRISGTVVVRIWVSPNGRVKGSPQVETSSGYPDLDQVVVGALKDWEFAPLGPDVKSEDQWGVITFKFTLS